MYHPRGSKDLFCDRARRADDNSAESTSRRPGKPEIEIATTQMADTRGLRGATFNGNGSRTLHARLSARERSLPSMQKLASPLLLHSSSIRDTLVGATSALFARLSDDPNDLASLKSIARFHSASSFASRARGSTRKSTYFLQGGNAPLL